MPKTPTNHSSSSSVIETPITPLPTPSLTSLQLNYSYTISRGETGVLTFEPYKSLLLPYWAFRTIPIANSSATTLFSIFQSYVERGDFVGADMTRKFIQMGMTRARRYANWKGGRKYKAGTKGELNERWSAEGVDGEEGRKRREKEEASEAFKGFWRRCVEDGGFRSLKERWVGEKKESERRRRRDGREEGGDGEEGVLKHESD